MLSLFGVGVEGAAVEQIGAVAALVSVLGWAPQAQHTTQPPTHLSHLSVSTEGVRCVHCCEGFLHHHHRGTLSGSAGRIVGCSALASHEIKLKYVMRGKNLRCGRETASFPDPAHSICFPSGYTVVFLILVKVYKRNLKLVLEMSNKWMVRFS